MKVAFATKDLETVNDHFGWARKFAIYEITKDGYEFVRVAETPEDPDDEDDKINLKIDLIKDVSLMYCEAIGPTAAARVVKAKIHPLKVPQPVSITEQALALVEMLKGNPPPWIRRIVEREASEATHG